jgi:transcriptional regulator with XRE-family HTH domain
MILYDYFTNLINRVHGTESKEQAVDVSLAIRRRLDELGLEQKDLARAARVTESYVSQLLTRKKTPPAPSRTDIYDKMDRFLKLPTGELARVAESQRKLDLKRELGEEPAPLFREVRALVLRKCAAESRQYIGAIFERQPFGELERLVTQTLLDVVKRVAQKELENDDWLRNVAGLSGRSYEEMRVMVLEFLDTNIFHVSAEQCAAFLDPLIASWDVDLATFGLEIRLNHQMAAEHVRRFDFVERGPARPGEAPGLRAFLQDRSMSGTVTEEELAFLKRLGFTNKRPTALYYYRELQNLRDPLHFEATDHPPRGP